MDRLVLICWMYSMEMGRVKKGGQFMKRKVYSLMLALTVCVSMAFSTSNPVKAESAHADCEHMTPPKVLTEDLGYNYNSTHHWKIFRHTVRCSACNNVMQVTSTEGEKGQHVRYGSDRKCFYCPHTL